MTRCFDDDGTRLFSDPLPCFLADHHVQIVRHPRALAYTAAPPAGTRIDSAPSILPQVRPAAALACPTGMACFPPPDREAAGLDHSFSRAARCQLQEASFRERQRRRLCRHDEMIEHADFDQRQYLLEVGGQ